jgi:hypothetical protein
MCWYVTLARWHAAATINKIEILTKKMRLEKKSVIGVVVSKGKRAVVEIYA